jgi:hypothetical protein
MAEGGGGMALASYGITIDAMDTREVQPDQLVLVGWCQVTANTKREANTAQADFLDELTQDVRGQASVTNGEASIMPATDPFTGMPLARAFSSSFSVELDVASAGNLEALTDLLEDRGCSVSLDARVTDQHRLHNAALPELLRQVKARQAFFETIVGGSLRPASVSINTYVDSYSSYDPESNTALATTTLTVQFALAD